MNDIRRIQDHRISLERVTGKLEDARDLTSNIRKHSNRHRIPFGKSQGAGLGVRAVGGLWKPEADEPFGLGAFEDLDMFSHQIFKILIPGLEVGKSEERTMGVFAHSVSMTQMQASMYTVHLPELAVPESLS